MKVYLFIYEPYPWAQSVVNCNASVMVVDCAAVKTGCMLEKYVPAKGCNEVRVHFYFLVQVLLLLQRAAAAVHNIST